MRQSVFGMISGIAAASMMIGDVPTVDPIVSDHPATITKRERAYRKKREKIKKRSRANNRA